MRRPLFLAPFLAVALVTGSFSAAPAATLRGKAAHGAGGTLDEPVPVRLVCRTGGEWSAPDGRAGFRFDDLPEGEEHPFVLHATYRGVPYRTALVLAAGADTSVTAAVFDTTRSAEGLAVREMEIRLAREGEALRIDQIYRVENGTEPPRTVVDPDRGAFPVRLPVDAAEAGDLSLAASDGIVPARLAPLPGEDRAELRADHAFRPGFSALALTYDLSCPDTLAYRAVLPYPVDRLVVVAPPGATLDGPGLESAHMAGRGPAVFYREGLERGAEIRFTLQGGDPMPPPDEEEGEVGLGPFPFEERTPLLLAILSAVLLGALAASMLRRGGRR